MKKLIKYIIMLAIIGGLYIGIKDGKFDDIAEKIQINKDDVISSIMEKLVVTENTIKKPRAVAELIDVDVNKAFLYQFLTEEQKKVYSQILTGIQAQEERIGVDPIKDEDIGKCLESVLGDHPEFFWLTGDSTIWMNKSETRKEIELVYNIDATSIEPTRKAIEEVVDTAIAGFSSGEMSTYDKVKQIYEYIILNTDYQLDCDQNQNIQSVFLNKTSVCAGYAKAFQYMVQRAGMFCGYITGQVRISGEEHAWNLISIDNKYYYVDATWGDPAYENQKENVSDNISYDYLCITTDELLRTHIPNMTQGLPICESHDYDYYQLNYLYLDTYDVNTVIEYLKSSIRNQDKETFIKFSNQAAFLEAKHQLFEQEGIKPAAMLKMELDGLEEYQYSYWSNDNYFILKVRW